VVSQPLCGPVTAVKQEGLMEAMREECQRESSDQQSPSCSKHRCHARLCCRRLV